MTLLPPPHVYPADMPLAELRTSELLLTTTLRLFALAWRTCSEAHPDWRGGMLAAGLSLDTAGAFDKLFAMVVIARRRPLDVRCLHCRTLSPDEDRLLQIVSLFQHGRREAAAAALGDWLPPTAQRLAVAPAQALAEAMAARKLIVPWRHAEAARYETCRHGYRSGLTLVQ
jgi:hypothetical protein